MTPDEIVDRWYSPQFVASNETLEHGGYKTGRSDNPICGDVCIMFVNVRSHNLYTEILDARHSTQGCTLTVAAADLLCEMMIGKRIDFEINLFDILGIPIGVNRRQCVLTPLQAFKEALK